MIPGTLYGWMSYMLVKLLMGLDVTHLSPGSLLVRGIHQELR
jgi:hypothetical protein